MKYWTMLRSILFSFFLVTSLVLGGCKPILKETPATSDKIQVVLDFNDNLTIDQIEAFNQLHGINASFSSTFSKENEKYQVTQLLPLNEAQKLVNTLSSNENLENVELMATYTIPDVGSGGIPTFDYSVLAGEPNDPMYKYQWHMRNIHMVEAQKVTRGKGVIVAVIDTGVAYEDYTDPSTGQKFTKVEDLKNTCFVPGYNFVNDTPHANDDHTHGTHVTGTIAQSTNNGVGVTGIAYEACIMPLKVLAAQGGGSTTAIADAIKWAADHKANVINMSLGGPFPSGIMKDAVDYAHKKGVVIIAAAGNDSKSKVGYPAGYEHVIAVSATDLNNEPSFYTNWGKDVDIAAPGGDTRADKNKDGVPDGVVQNTIKVQKPLEHGYLPFQGTSMASPHTAGVAALIMSLGVKDPDKVAKILYESADKSFLKGEKRNDHYGYGLLDAAKAVSMTKKEIESTTTTAEAGKEASILDMVETWLFFGLVLLLYFSAVLPLLLFAFLYKTKYRPLVGVAAIVQAGVMVYAINLIFAVPSPLIDWLMLTAGVAWLGLNFLVLLFIVIVSFNKSNNGISFRSPA